MPAVGERKTKGGVTGEWDGTTWRRVDAAPAGEASRALAVGTRKTKDGVTGEWDGQTWRRVEAPAEPQKSSGEGALAAGAGLAGLAAAVPAARALAERVATSPMINAAVGKAGSALGAGVNPLYQAYEVVSGRKGLGKAVKDGLVTEAGRRALAAIPRAATGVANALGAEGVAGLSAPAGVAAAGGLAGLAGTSAFLGALQHDANRRVDIDYSKRTPDTDIAKVFMNMRNSEANRGKSLEERMDDPNDVMFRPDDAEVVRAAVLQQLR